MNINDIKVGSKVRVTITGEAITGRSTGRKLVLVEGANFGPLSSYDLEGLDIEVVQGPPQLAVGDFFAHPLSTVDNPGFVGLVTKTGYVTIAGSSAGRELPFSLSSLNEMGYRKVTPAEAARIAAAKVERDEGTNVEF